MALRITRNFNNFKTLAAKTPQAARKLEEKHCKAWASVMRQIMPSVTGAMIESTEAVQLGNQHWGVKIGVDYWRHVNDGTIYITGQHFVEESRELIRGGFVSDVNRFVRYVRAE